MNLQVYCKILITKLNIASRSLGFVENPLERFGGSHLGPWPVWKTGKGGAGCFPARELAGGEDPGVEEDVGVESYL